MQIVKVRKFALANDWADSAGPQGSAAGYWHVLERMAEALGPDMLAHLTDAGDLVSFDGRWSYRAAPRSAYTLRKG
jgi:hypothetical protein